MAEELPLSEDTGAPSLAENRFVLPKFPEMLPAKPEAINPYYDVVGNSLVGSDPIIRNPSSDNSGPDFIDSLLQKDNPIEENPYYAMKPYTYSGDMDNNLFERYHSTGDVYDKLGFSPYRNNEALYNKNMTLGDEFVRAAKQWDDLVGVGFMSGIRSWETIFTDPLAPDMKGAKDMKHIMDVGSSGKGGIGGFFINTFLNSGYTVGVGMDFLAEELVLAGATAATGGAGGGAMIGKGLSAINKLFRIGEKTKTGTQATHAATDILRAGEDVNELSGIREIGNNFAQSRTFWNKLGGGTKAFVTGTADILNPLDNTVAALKATDYATNYAKTVKTFGAFADDLLMMKAAVSEAKLEGGMVKMDVTEKLIDEYRNDKVKNPDGKLPEGEELKNIEKIALDEATKTAFWNLPAIMTSNKLMYATMLAPLRTIMGREMEALVPEIIYENKVFQEVGEGIFDRAKVAAKSLRKPKIYGQYGMNYLKANLAEGVQENIQDAISQGAIEEAMALYRDPIRASYEGYMPHFMKHLKAQLSAQGAETFAGGFLMGMFAQPVMAAPSVGISKLLNSTINRENIEKFKEERQKQLRGWDEKDENGNVIRHHMGTLEYLNDMANDGKGNINLDYVAPDLINAVRTGRLANDMFSAARIGDKMGTINSRGALENHHLLTAIRTGKLDTILERLKDYRNLTKEEAKEAFAKYGITEDQDIEKALSHIDGVIERAKNLQETYKDAANRYPNPVNPKDFKNDPVKYRAALITKLAWDDAVYQLVFAKATFEDYSKRVADMANTFAKISQSIGQEDSQSIMALLGSQSMVDEINMLRREISVLDESDPEQKKRKKDKTARLEKIQKFYDVLIETKNAKTEDEQKDAHERAKEAFGDYVQHLAKKNGRLVFNDSLTEAYNIIRDHLLLKDDLAGLAASINVLMAPKSFMAVQQKMLLGYSFMFSDQALKDTLSLNADQFGFAKDLKDTATEITAKTKQPSLLVPNEILIAAAEAFQNKTAWPIPTYFIDASDGTTQVTEGESFDKALQMWKGFIATQKQPEDTTISESFDREDITTFPEDLITLLRISYDALPEDVRAKLSFEDFATQPGDSTSIINNYFEKLLEEGLDYPTEWKDLNLESLKELQTKLLEEAKTDKTLDEKLMKLRNYIGIRTMRESDRTPEQQQAWAALQALTKNAEDIEKNKKGYWIRGAYTDTRITNLIYNVILPEKYDKQKVAFSQRDNTQAGINKVRSTFEEGKTRKLDTKAIINNVVELVIKPQFGKIFDDQKIADIKQEMGDSTDVEKFISLLDEYAYKESTKAGDTVDALVRSFFTYGAMKKPENMSLEAFNTLRDSLFNVMDELERLGEVIVAKGLIVDGVVNVDGKRQTIGGEMDLVVITPNGQFKIYDIKTGKKGLYNKAGKRERAGSWDFYGTDDDEYQKKTGYQLQLSLYADLLENATGIKVKRDELRIIPFEVDIDNNGYIKTLELKDEPKNTELEYDPVVREYVVPTKKGMTPVSLTTSAAVAEKAAAMQGKVRDVRKPLPNTFEELQDQEVEWKGMIGTIRIYGPDDIVFETENAEYTVEIDKDTPTYSVWKKGILANPKDYGFEGLITKEVYAKAGDKKYDIVVQDEENVEVNGMFYYINTDSKGNVESLSPVNKPDQKIRNERLITAVEIERNKLDYKTPDEVIDQVLELKGLNTTTTLIEGIYNKNMMPEIADALDKLYNSEKMSKFEKELVELWVHDTELNLYDLMKKDIYDKKEIQGAINNLNNIINILYEEQYTKKQKGKTSDKQASVSGTTEKGKRTITTASSKEQANKVVEKEKLLVTSRPAVDIKKVRAKVIKEVLPKLLDPVLLSKLPGERLLYKLLSTKDFNHFLNSINFTENVKIYPEELGLDVFNNYIKNWDAIKAEVSEALKKYLEGPAPETTEKKQLLTFEIKESLKPGTILVDKKGKEYTFVSYDRGSDPEYSRDDNVTFPGEPEMLIAKDSKGREISFQEYEIAGLFVKEAKVGEVARNTIEDLNKAKDKEAFKIAKKRNYEVVYNNIRYSISKIGKNFVHLKAPNLPEIKLSYAEAFLLTDIVDPEGLRVTKDDEDTIDRNKDILSGKDKSFVVKPKEEAFKNLIEAALKC